MIDPRAKSDEDILNRFNKQFGEPISEIAISCHKDIQKFIISEIQEARSDERKKIKEKILGKVRYFYSNRIVDLEIDHVKKILNEVCGGK